MDDDLLLSFTKDKSPEEMLWESTRDYLHSLSPAVEDAAYRGMIVHWFNPPILRALMRSGRLTKLGQLAEKPNTSAASEYYKQIQKLPFVEEYSNLGFGFHELTRQMALRKLWQEEPEFYRSVSRAAARYFSRGLKTKRGLGQNELAEWIYHLWIANEERALEVMEEVLEQLVEQGLLSVYHALIQMAEEHLEAGRLSSYAGWWVHIWRLRKEFISHKHDRVEQLAQEALSTSAEEVPLIIKGVAAYYLAHTLRATGHPEEARRWFEEAYHFHQQAERPEPMINMLMELGDLSANQDQYEEAKNFYNQALELYFLTFYDDSASGALESEIEEPSPVEEPAGLSYVIQLYDPLCWVRRVEPIQEAASAPTSPQPSSPESEPVPPLRVWYEVLAYPETGDEAEPPAEADLVLPVRISEQLGDLWLRIGSLHYNRGHYDLAQACVNLAGQLFVDLDSYDGVERAARLLRSIAAAQGNRELMETSLEYLKWVLQVTQDHGNLFGELSALLSLADIYYVEMDYAASRQYYQNALELANLVEDAINKGYIHTKLAALEIAAGNYEKAVEQFNQAKTVYQQILYQEGLANLFLSLGDFELGRFRPARAEENYRKALTIYQELNIPNGQIHALRGLGIVAQDRVRYDDAVRYLEQGIALAQQVDNPKLELACLQNLIRVYDRRDDRQKSRESCQRALHLTRLLGDRAEEASTQVSAGYVELSEDKYDEALVCFQNALDIYTTTKNIAGQLDALLGILQAQTDQEDFTAARQTAEKLLGLAEQVDDQSYRIQVFMNVGLTYSSAGDSELALAYLEKAASLESDDPTLVGNLGWALYEAGQYQRSIELSQKAYRMDPTQTWVLRNIGHAYLALGDPEQAEQLYRKAIELRQEGEHFKETLKVIRKLLQEKPDTRGGQELLHLIEQAQAQIEAEV